MECDSAMEDLEIVFADGQKKTFEVLTVSHNALLNVIYSCDCKGSNRSSDFGHNPQLCQ